ncbi:MAG: hypothetical protein AAFX78_20445, partial [Cyanobacteria bacterium J06638_20]
HLVQTVIVRILIQRDVRIIDIVVIGQRSRADLMGRVVAEAGGDVVARPVLTDRGYQTGEIAS